MTIMELAPEANVGAGLGTADLPGACELVLQDDSLHSGEMLKTYLGSGQRCIQLYDAGDPHQP
jgi:hypothetical protein